MTAIVYWEPNRLTPVFMLFSRGDSASLWLVARVVSLHSLFSTLETMTVMASRPGGKSPTTCLMKMPLMLFGIMMQMV